jgi:hypothetical protein
VNQAKHQFAFIGARDVHAFMLLVGHIIRLQKNTKKTQSRNFSLELSLKDPCGELDDF